MQFVTDNASISFDIIHEELRDERTPLLFLHSALGTRHEFDKLRYHFPDRTLILPDFPSHGESTSTRDSITTADLAGSIDALLTDALHIPVVDIIGYSMGGYVALELALRSPHSVSKIVCHAMKFFWTPESIASTVADMESIRSRSEKAYTALSAMHATNGFERTAMLASSVVSSFRDRKLEPEDLLSLSQPILFSTGDSDSMVTPEETVRLYQTQPREKRYLAIEPNSPHQISKLDLIAFTHACRVIL